MTAVRTLVSLGVSGWDLSDLLEEREARPLEEEAPAVMEIGRSSESLVLTVAGGAIDGMLETKQLRRTSSLLNCARFYHLRPRFRLHFHLPATMAPLLLL